MLNYVLLLIVQETNVSLLIKILKGLYWGKVQNRNKGHKRKYEKQIYNVQMCADSTWLIANFPQINSEFNAIPIRIPTQLLIAFIGV